MERRPRRYVTIEGYAAEGGFDGPYLPATCYLATIALGRHAGPGEGEDLWHEYERVLDLAATLGLDGVRLSVEWARIEPRRDEVDQAALERYAEVARHATSLGLGVSVTLVDAAWPAWLGMEAWLLPWVVPRVMTQARRVVTAIDSASGLVPFASVDELVLGGYVESSSPPWRRGARGDAAFARAQIDSIVAALRDDPLVGPKLVSSHSTVSLARPPELVASALGEASGDEVYLRSLVRGRGPTQSPAGLLTRRDGEWNVDAEAALLEVLR